MDPTTEVVVAPSPIFLHLVRNQLKPEIGVSAQNIFDKPNGAFTGEISAEQLVDSKIDWTLTGHSERRVLCGETDAFVASKTKAALDAGLKVVLCIGETLQQREAQETITVVTQQLNAVKEKTKDWSQIVIAYEPVLAIGTGKVATTEQAQEVHAAIRHWLSTEISKEAAEQTRIIYGGSVNEKNAGELGAQPDVDGFLVGGASLKPACRFHADRKIDQMELTRPTQSLRLSILGKHPKPENKKGSNSGRTRPERYKGGRMMWL